jgi:hypothetical protein
VASRVRVNNPNWEESSGAFLYARGRGEHGGHRKPDSNGSTRTCRDDGITVGGLPREPYVLPVHRGISQITTVLNNLIFF